MPDLLAGSVAAALSAAAIGPASRLCCALSGGVDSVVLLDLLARLQPRFGYALTAAHVHHGLSPNAGHWAAFCEDLCRARGVPLGVERVEVARDDPAGLEAAARRARLDALARQPCDWLVFAHHQDDQAETLLFRLLRGTGVRGAAAMAAQTVAAGGRPGGLRPLLGQRRADIETYAQQQGLRWVEDESNADCRFARNALRHRVLPVIEAGFPGAVPALARAADNFREADALLAELAEADEAACGGVPMRRERLLALSPARLANLLRWQAARLGLATPPRARLLEALRQLGTAAAEQPLHLALGEFDCCVYRGRVWIEAAAGALPVPQVWRGEASLAWAGGRVCFDPAVGGGLSRARLDRAGEVRLVPRAAGMRLRLEAGRPSRSFKNLCQEVGIPAWLRDRLPVLEVDGEAAWVGGIGVAAAFRCEPGQAGVQAEWLPASVAQRGEHLREFDG